MKNTYYNKAKEILENLHQNYSKNIRNLLLLAEVYEILNLTSNSIAICSEIVSMGKGKDINEIRKII